MVVHLRKTKQEVWQCDRAQLQLLFGSAAWELRKAPGAGPTSPG